MKITSSQIDAIFQETDIEGLIAQGAPYDEYSSEAEFVASSLGALPQDSFSEEAIVAIISSIWAQTFNLAENELSLRLPDIRKAAGLILNIKKA